ncbi:hypothetical protein [Mesorhizobium mediterraneum]|uniref:hypothetical protein n=1 Tax=Mesorhizobium mediterraneum TaxID=43617 RepID=UPI001784474B|nr:hypothetical protein [Mesorhizobium mediterraneum]
MNTYSICQGNMSVGPLPAGLSKPGQDRAAEATGRCGAYLVFRALGEIGLDPRGATAIVQCFCNVGSVAATIAQQGVKIIGVSDHMAAYF